MKKPVFYCVMLVFLHQLSYAQWVRQNSPITQRLNSVQFLSPTTGYIAGDFGTILKTTNGGTSWNILNPGTNAAFNVVRFVNDTGYLFGNGPTVLRTTNGGDNWTPLILSIPGATGLGYVNSAYMFDGKTGVICGYYVVSPNLESFTARTTNAGEKWQIQQYDSITFLNSVTFTDPSTGYVVGGKNGAMSPILKTTDGGTTWSILQSNTIYFLHSVFFANTSTGYIGGSFGKVFITTDAGKSWTAQNNGFDDFSSLFAVSPATVYAVTEGFPEGEIYRSNDSGKTWTTQFSHTKSFHSVFFADAQTGFAVGDSGYIFKTTNGGTTSVEKRSPSTSGFRLEQNFPNPFNPTTVIEYELPKATFVKIIVYDMLGRRVELLVNEEKSSGNYKVEFDANDLSSGIYFYQLQTKEFSQTKKILLMK